MADMQELETRLKSIADYVQDCQRRVLKGEIMDLQGLDKNVVEICDAVATLPHKDAMVLEKKMLALINHLEILARSMKDQQEKITGTGGR